MNNPTTDAPPPRPTIDQAEEIKQAALKEAVDREVFDKIEYICIKATDNKVPLLGSGVIVAYSPVRRFAKAYRAENEGRLIFSAKRMKETDPGGIIGYKLYIQVFRTGSWVGVLEETYNSVKFKAEKPDIRKIMRDFWPLQGDWDEP